MITKTLTLLLIFQISLQACGKGCLTCKEGKDECQLCDATRKYFLDKTTKGCKLSTLSDCQVYSSSGACLVANPGFYYNSSTKKVVAVTASKLEANPKCTIWSSTQSCVACEKDHYISGTKCTAVDTAIASCAQYESVDKCKMCEPNFDVADDKLSCVAVPSMSNCATFKTQDCNKCNSSSLMNFNAFVSYTQDVTKQFDSITGRMAYEKAGTMEADVSTCQTVQVQNCAKPATKDTCEICMPTHYMTAAKTCAINPIEKIADCKNYSTNTTCVECNSGFRINSGKCVAVDLIDNCSKYSPTSTSSHCIQCKDDFYVSSSKTSCTARTKRALKSSDGTSSSITPIPDCSKYHLSKDTCGECKSNFVGKESSSGSGQFSRCVAKISSCETYNIPSSSTSDATCTKCVNGKYPDSANGNKGCIDGSVTDCMIYNASSGTCKECKNKFYLLNNTCTAHVSVPKCVSYDVAKKNMCTDCEKGTFPLKVISECTTTFNEVANCKTYDMANSTAPTATCTACEDTYFLASGTSCVAIANLPGCIAASSATATECTTCQKGMGKNKRNGATYLCKAPLGPISANCAGDDETKFTSAESNLMECKTCSQGSYPLSMTNNTVCLNADRHDSASATDIDSALANCQIFHHDGKCNQCTAGKFLKADYTACLDTCATTVIAYKEVNGHILRNICRALVAGVSLVAFDMETAGDAAMYQTATMPIKCADGYIPVVDLTSTVVNHSNVDPNMVNSATNPDFVTDMMFRTPKITCAVHTTNTSIYDGVESLTAPPTYCELWKETGDEHMCQKCAGNKTGNHVEGGILCDTPITHCNPNKISNLPVQWTKLSSCYSCSQANYVSVMFAQLVATTLVWTGFANYDVANTANNNANTGKLHHCIPHTAAGFLVVLPGKAVVMTDLVPNCAFYVINTTALPNAMDVTASNDVGVDNSDIACGYCKPGFKPTEKNLSHFVHLCTAIARCDTNLGNKWANACSKCATGSVWEWTSNKPDYTSCVAVANRPNCHSYNVSSTSCMVCNKGYFLNQDANCVSIQVPGCQSNKFADSTAWPVTNGNNYFFQNPSLFTYMVQNPFGCSSCSTGKGFTKKASTEIIASKYCVGMSFVSQHTNLVAGTTKYIPNCENYSSQTANTAPRYKCDLCQSDYILMDDQTKCIAKSAVANCQTAATATTCLKCEKTHSLNSAGACGAPNLANCTTPNWETANATPMCIDCQNNYFWNTTTRTCTEGNVQNCAKYSDQLGNICQNCMTGYSVMGSSQIQANQFPSVSTDSITRNYCVKVTETFGCSSYTIADVGNGNYEYTCDTCNDDFVKPIANTVPKGVCSAFSPIAKCLDYYVGKDRNDTNFSCTMCDKGFRRDKIGYECKARVYNPSACALFDPTLDQCNICKSNNFLATNKQECTSFPDGLLGCSAYNTIEGKRTCIKCQEATWYLNAEKNICVNVAETKRDSNCAKVKGDNECEVCAKNYFLTDGKPAGADETVTLLNNCVQSDITNCTTLSALTTCDVCDQGYKKVTDNAGITSCSDIGNSSCLLWEGEQCAQCGEGEQQDSTDAGKCVTATTSVTNCMLYDSSSTCIQCVEDAVLNNNECLLNKTIRQANCVDLREDGSFKCSSCKSGYEFDQSGNCVDGGVTGASKGCGGRSEKNGKCLYCLSGYGMDQELNCKNDTPIITPEPSFANSLKVSLIMLFALLELLN